MQREPTTTEREPGALGQGARGQGFGALYREEGKRLWRAIYAFAGDREIANDAVSEAFAQCIRRGGEIREPKAWVWRAAFRIAAGELKARARWEALPTIERAEQSSDSRVLEALGQLPTRQRAAVLLFHYAGYPVREIAGMLGVAAPTVRVHLTRGRRRLRELLEDDHDGP